MKRYYRVLISRAVLVSAGLIYALFITRFGGAEEAGRFFISISVLSSGVLLLRGGLQEPLLRLLSVGYASGEYRWMRSANRWIAFYSAFGGVLLITVIYAAGRPIASKVFNEPSLDDELFIAALAIPPLTYIWLMSSFFKAMNKPSTALVFDFNGVALLSLPLVLLLGWIHHVNAREALVCFVFMAYGLAGLGLVGFIRLCPCAGAEKKIFRWKEVSRSFVPMLVASLASFLLSMSPILFIGSAVDAKSAGIFAIAMKLSRVMIVINSIINAVFSRRFALASAAGRYDRLVVDVRTAGIIATTLSLLPFGVLLCFPNIILSMFGESMVEGRVVLLILATGTFFEVALGPAGAALTMMEKERHVRNIMLLAAVAFLIATYVWWQNPQIEAYAAIIAVVSAGVKAVAVLVLMRIVSAQIGGNTC